MFEYGNKSKLISFQLSASEADSSNSDCVRERNEALEIARRPTFGVYIPECKQDGTYTERQCHVTSGFCWCVTPDGKPIEGTPVHGRDPACRGINCQFPVPVPCASSCGPCGIVVFDNTALLTKQLCIHMFGDCCAHPCYKSDRMNYTCF